MKRYKVLSEHSFLKSGLILELLEKEERYRVIGFTLTFSYNAINNWLDMKWIEFIEVPVWTDRDMKLFGAHNASKTGKNINFFILKMSWINIKNDLYNRCGAKP